MDTLLSLGSFKKFFIIVSCVWVFRPSVCTPCELRTHGGQEGDEVSPRTGVTTGRELPHECWQPNCGPLQTQAMVSLNHLSRPHLWDFTFRLGAAGTSVALAPASRSDVPCI